MTDQLIFNFERIEGVSTEFAILSLDNVSSDQEMSDRGLLKQPTPAFIDSIRKFGQIDPILALEKIESNGMKWYQVWSGSRRVRALRQLVSYGEIENTVKAQVIKEEWNIPYDVLLIALNAARDSNEIADYFAIRRIMKENPEMSLKDIAHALHNNLTISEIKKRLSLGRIPDTLLEGVSTSLLTLSTARTISKLPKAIQAESIDKVEKALKLIDETKSMNLPVKQEEEVIRDIIHEHRIATKSIKEAKIQNANNVAQKLGNLLDNGKDSNTKKIKEPDITFLVFPANQVTKFTNKQEAELYRQKMTAETGEQFMLIAKEA